MWILTMAVCNETMIAYHQRLEQIKEIGLSDQTNVCDLLRTLLDSLNRDLQFLNSG